ncbi:radial spoke head 10 homolog B [Pelobates fuscus]|uniref:radial spoke head 10 homolog B n=1 Tax=Pelobates fuscus TaxID=191477 RepID=UPI002FE4A97B
MGKTKKKEIKKTEKITLEITEDNSSKLSPVSISPIEELSPQPLISLPPDEPIKQEEPPVSEPVLEVYEGPVLAELIVERYEGDMVHGMYEGEGVAYFKDGNVYKGTFCEGFMHGNGIYTWTDGLAYQGEFYVNCPIGYGIYRWPNGSQYEGQVYKGIRHGRGIFISSNQQVSYVGEWHKGARHGKGTIYYNAEQTSWYEGDWIMNTKEGWGVQCFKSGNIYEGQWKNNRFNGEGCMRWLSSNEEYMGQWVNGIQNGHGAHTWFIKRVAGSQYSLRNEYVGNFVDGQREGHGVFYYANGAMYDGEWNNNKKHGMGKFVFKNGKIYVGEFVADQIAEFPNFKYDRVNTPDLSGIRTRSPLGEEKLSVSRFNSGIPSLAGSYIELDISSLLDKFPESEQLEELKQVEYAVLRNLTELRKIYKLYSSLGSANSFDNAFVMTRMQFWRFLKDCRFHHYNLTLIEMNRFLDADNVEIEKMHSPHTTMVLRTFLNNIIYLAYRIGNKEIPQKCTSIVDCFSRVMNENILPHARNIKGFLFSVPQKTPHAMCYFERCWDIYRIYCQPNAAAPHEPTMKMRQFIWLMNDFKITGKVLTVTQLVHILGSDDPNVRSSNEINLELELTILEFFEALLGCAMLIVTDEPADLPNKETYKDEESQKTMFDVPSDVSEKQPDNLPLVKSPCVPEDQAPNKDMLATGRKQTPSTPTYSTKNLQSETATNKWFYQISQFFMTIFFPAHEYAEQVQQEIPKIREQQAELARIRQIEEEARRQKQEEEEAIRSAQMEVEKATASMEKVQVTQEVTEDDKTSQRPVTPKEEHPSAPQTSSTKPTPGTMKKRKK